MRRHKSMMLIALVIGALLLSSAIPVLGSGAAAEAASASSATQPVQKLGTGSPSDLPFLQLPADLVAGSPLNGNPPVTPPGKDKKANKYAVVIGIADYQGTEYDVWHPDEDAEEMAQALIEIYGFPEGNVKLLLNKKAKAGAILGAINWLSAREDADSTVVFFYSGHGWQLPDVYGLDNDFENDTNDEGIVSYDLQFIPDGYLAALFDGFESQKFALIFNTCNSGGMFDDDDDLQTEGRVIVSACKADQPAYDIPGLGNTLFGYFFVDEGILDGEADVNGDGAVSIEEAWAYAGYWVTQVVLDSEPQIFDGFAGELIP